MLSKIATLPICMSHFHVPTNPSAHPSFIFLKIICFSPTMLMVNKKNKWKSTKLMDMYYVVGVCAIPNPKFGQNNQLHVKG